MAYGYITSKTGNYQILKDFAKNNRQSPTDAESVLWERLRRRQLGANFRRQHPIGDYIADFVCLDRKLVIEVDGEYHYHGLMPENDEQRTEVLNRMGFRVIRFDNSEVLYNTDETINKIKNSLWKM